MRCGLYIGGRAKTLMFVQLNPDVTSYSESMSTLKFAERVSGVELGAAKTSKEGKDVRDLMEQVKVTHFLPSLFLSYLSLAINSRYMNHLLFLQLASLKDTIARKDEEIEKLLLVKDIHHPPQRLQKPMMRRKSIGHTDDINSDTGEYSSQQSRYSVTDGESLASSAEAEYDERLSEITSDAASNGTQGSMDVAKRPPKISDRLQQHILLSLLLMVLRDLFLFLTF